MTPSTDTIVQVLGSCAAQHRAAGRHDEAAVLDWTSSFFRQSQKDITAAAEVPVWENHADDEDGSFPLIGSLLEVYREWMDEQSDSLVEDCDGAGQLREVVAALTNTLDMLDETVFDRFGNSRNAP